MRVAVRFGDQTTELEVAHDRLIALSGDSARRPVTNLSDAVAAALESPLEFPPLRQAVVPGDHVAIVLDQGVPYPGDVLGPVVEHLFEAGVQAQDIQVVEVPPAVDSDSGLQRDGVPPGISLVKHDPRDRSRQSYLASTKSGVRVYLNREIVDAELVILVGRVDYHPILGYSGTAGSVFPGLADEAARRAFRSQISGPMTRQTRLDARRESDEVAWLLGVQFAVQLVLGEGNQVVAVLAGHCPAVQRKSEQLLDELWKRRVPRRAELVIAAISGKPAEQGFEQLGAVLAIASRLVCEGGRIVVLSTIDAVPGPALRAARGMEEPADVLGQLKRDPAADAISTWQITQARRGARVYLHSRLSSELVEDLLMIPVERVQEVQRLVKQADSCIILNDAQLAHASVEGEHEEPA